MTAGGGNLKVSRTPDGVRFAIHVTPRARRPGVGGLHGDALRVSVAAPPVEGEANRAVVAALARALGVRRGEVEITSGGRGRSKGVVVRGDPGELDRRLRALAGSEG